MRYATYRQAGRRFVGQVTPEGLRPLALPPQQADAGVLSVIDLLAAGERPGATGDPVALDAVELLAPIPLPRRNLWCVGRNYHAHARELATSVFKDNRNPPDSWPIVFTKVPPTVVGPRADVELPDPAITVQVDYEAELAVVIGRGGRDIPREAAMDHVFGYTVVNDVTARDVQMRHQQWDLGKSFDTFCPMGPWIVTRDEVDATDTRVRCWVNGELRQDGRTRDLIFDIPTLIATCSRGITLLPGDVIATGTPAGVGMGLDPPRWLADGDVVRIAIDGVGEIENTFRARRA